MHHSNIVPWQMLCERTGAVLKVIPMNQEGNWSWPNTTSYFQKTKIVATIHISNALGTINPIKYMIDQAHTYGAAVFDGAQAVPI
jgi:cysteine desulfurase/selenocysteine lyase